MKALWTAIYNKYTGSALPTSLTGGLHFTVAPEGTSAPFGVYYQISDAPEWTWSSDDERVLIQFSLFDRSDNATTIANLRDAWIGVFDDCSLSISGYTSIYMQRQPGGMVTQDENNFWHYIEEYEVFLSKS